MHWVFLPFFMLRLLGDLLPFLLKVAISFISPLKILILVLGVVGLYSSSFWYHRLELFPALVVDNSPSSPEISRLSTALELAHQNYGARPIPLDLETLQKNQEIFTDLLQKQPTHLQVLINLYFIETALGNNSQAQIYLDQILAQDPNHPLSKELSELEN